MTEEMRVADGCADEPSPEVAELLSSMPVFADESPRSRRGRAENAAWLRRAADALIANETLGLTATLAYADERPTTSITSTNHPLLAIETALASLAVVSYLTRNAVKELVDLLPPSTGDLDCAGTA